MKAARNVLGHFGNVLLAVILAVLVWVVAERQANPSSEKTFSNPIPIAIKNIPAGMVTYDASDQAVHVTVNTPDVVWNQINPEQVSASCACSWSRWLKRSCQYRLQSPASPRWDLPQARSKQLQRP